MRKRFYIEETVIILSSKLVKSNERKNLKKEKNGGHAFYHTALIAGMAPDKKKGIF